MMSGFKNMTLAPRIMISSIGINKPIRPPVIRVSLLVKKSSFFTDKKMDAKIHVIK